MHNQKSFAAMRSYAQLCTLIFLLFFNALNKAFTQQPTCNGWKIALNQANNVNCFSQEIPIRLSNDVVSSGTTVSIQKLRIEGELIVPNTSNPAEADISLSSGGLGGSFGGLLTFQTSPTNGKRTKFLINFDNFNSPVTAQLPNVLATLKITAPANLLYQLKVSNFEIQVAANPALCQKSNLLIAPTAQPAPTATSTDVRIFADVNNAVPIGNSMLKIPINIKQTIGTNGSNFFQNIAFKLKITDEFTNLVVLSPVSEFLPFFDLTLVNQNFIIGKTIQPFGIQGLNTANGGIIGYVNVKVKDGLPLQAGRSCFNFEWIMIEETLSAGSNSGQTACSAVLPSNNNVCAKVGNGNLPCIENDAITLSVPEPEQEGCILRYRVKLTNNGTGSATVYPRRIKIKATFDNPNGMTVNASSFKCGLINPAPSTCSVVVNGNTVEYTYANNNGTNLAPFSMQDNINSCGNSTGNNDLFVVEFSSTVVGVGSKISNFKIIEAEFANVSNLTQNCAFNHYTAYTGDGIVKGIKGTFTNCCAIPKGYKDITVTLNSATATCLPMPLFPSNCPAPTPSGLGCFPTSLVVNSKYEQCIATKGAFKLSACKSCNNPLDGISTLDLVLISKHILATQPLDKCQQYAADVNENGTVTTAYIVLLRRMILGLQSVFTPSGCYRFIEENALMNANCMADINLSNDEAITKFDANFKLIKKGDINCNAEGLVAPPKNEFTVRKESSTSAVLATQEFYYDFKPSNFTDIEGFQMGIRYDATQMEYIGQTALNLPLASEDNIANKTENGGTLNVVWVNPNTTAASLSEGQKMFRLTFKAKQNISNTLSLLNLDNTVLANEIYSLDNTSSSIFLGGIETRAIVLTSIANAGSGSNAKVGATSSQLGGISIKTIPNPFDKDLTLQVSAVSNMSVDIEIYDVMGRLMLHQKNTLYKGANMVELHNVQQWAKGNYTIKVIDELTKEQFFSKVQKI